VSIFISLQFIDYILQLLFLPMSEVIRENGDFEIITTIALGGHSRMAMKISLFVALFVSILFTNRVTVFSFYISAVFVYILEKLIIAKWYMLGAENKVINIEYYLDFIMLCILIFGLVSSFIFFKLKNRN